MDAAQRVDARQAHAEASNYPFCTIDQNVGVAPVPDPEWGKLAELLQPKETVPTSIRFVDVAGLVSGASKGEGLGNKFLGHLDAILHVVRCFEDENVAHTTGAPDPVRDVEIVETEMLLADLETAERASARFSNEKLSAWQIPRGTHAAQAAGKIHSDMERGFIRAEVMALSDLYQWKSRQALHDHGLIHAVGRDYEVQDRDVLHIHFNA